VESQALVEIDGEPCVRIDARSPFAGRGQGLQVVPDAKAIVSHCSPRWHGKKHGGGGFYENYTKDGKPIIGSRASLREAQRRAAWAGEKIERMRDLPDAD
jgi:hypothetical protein